MLVNPTVLFRKEFDVKFSLRTIAHLKQYRGVMHFLLGFLSCARYAIFCFGPTRYGLRINCYILAKIITGLTHQSAESPLKT
jgi:hypothetical protein